ncbi:MAG: adenylosuccinate synthetase, partial [Candidatus Bipolaricaulota bacterium]|nr:adenylosuccinate synthetase [Candidatus Bipolaricaulota bacterium]
MGSFHLPPTTHHKPLTIHYLPPTIHPPPIRRNSMSKAILGMQWGDEGKGKITHLLAREAA